MVRSQRTVEVVHPRPAESFRFRRATAFPRALASAALGLSIVALACSSSRRQGAVDPERQSDSEYDVARDLFMNRHDARGALAHAQKAVELNEDNADAQHMVALLYLYFCSTSPGECRLAEAEKYARNALHAKGDFREAKNTLGVVLVQEKKYDEAIGVLKPLTEDILYTHPEDAWGNLGQAYLEKGSVDLAVDALRRSVAAEPRFCVGNYRLGLAFEKKGDLAAAREALTRAIETDRPECQGLQDAYEARGRVLLAAKDCDGAKRDFEKCKALSAESPTGQRCAAGLRTVPC